jgi:hypothetical protein
MASPYNMLLSTDEPQADVSYTDDTDVRSESTDHSCCLFHCAYFPVGEFWLCGHWIVHLMRPLFVSILGFGLTAVALYDIYFHPFGLNLRTVSLVSLLIFSFVNMAFSFWALIVVGPGYLPFNFPKFGLRSDQQTWQQQLATFVTYREQGEYARSAPGRPVRAPFSMIARRFVIRGDHFCVWTESWIGIKNHRYFMTMLLWVIVFAAAWFALHIPWAYHFLPFHWVSVLTIALGVGLLAVVCIAGGFLVRAMRHLSRNWTLVEFWKQSGSSVSETYDRGCFENWAEVCGKKACCCFWPCPLICLEPTIDGLYRTQV